MIIELKLFAAARESCGIDTVSLELPAGATVADLRSELTAQFPGLASLLPASLIAIEHDYAADDRTIPEGAEIALIPPVSGG